MTVAEQNLVVQEGLQEKLDLEVPLGIKNSIGNLQTGEKPTMKESTDVENSKLETQFSAHAIPQALSMEKQNMEDLDKIDRLIPEQNRVNESMLSWVDLDSETENVLTNAVVVPSRQKGAWRWTKQRSRAVGKGAKRRLDRVDWRRLRGGVWKGTRRTVGFTLGAARMVCLGGWRLTKGTWTLTKGTVNLLLCRAQPEMQRQRRRRRKGGRTETAGTWSFYGGSTTTGRNDNRSKAKNRNKTNVRNKRESGETKEAKMNKRKMEDWNKNRGQNLNGKQKHGKGERKRRTTPEGGEEWKVNEPRKKKSSKGIKDVEKAAENVVNKRNPRQVK